jgi:hypothetical protein
MPCPELHSETARSPLWLPHFAQWHAQPHVVPALAGQWRNEKTCQRKIVFGLNRLRMQTLESREIVTNTIVRKLSRYVALLVPVVVMALGVNVVHAKNVRKQNLLELLTHTDSIVVGTVTETTDGFQDGLPYTEVTVLVAQNIKGADDEVVTFRQFGLIAPKQTEDGRVNLMVTPAGWPTWVKGEQVMLFLHKPASETGFQTTAGLTQGKFSIRGNEIANGINNDALFDRMKVTVAVSPTHEDLINQPGGAYAAEAFISLIRTAVEGDWIENGGMINAQ